MTQESQPVPIGDAHAGVVGHAWSENPELLRQCIASGQVEAAAIVAHGLELGADTSGAGRAAHGLAQRAPSHDYPACAVFRGGKCTCDEGQQ
jgi:hypothetical protein